MSRPQYPTDASGYITDPEITLSDGFTEITEIHRSERNIVLRAKRFGRWWALKCALPQCGAAGAAALRKEFGIALMLPRDAGANAYAVESVPGYGPCIVMDFIEGPTLHEWLDKNPDRHNRSEMALKLIEVVGRIHACGVVHRDIKPQNIIIASPGERPVLIDFGLADTALHAELKQPAGTRGYMAPEQYYAERPDVRNDIYSLGCVLGEMHLSRGWNRVIRRALLPIDRRPADTAALISIHRKSAIFRRAATIFLAFALIVAAIAFSVSRMSAPAPENPAIRLRADSLARTLDSLRLESNRQIAGLGADLGRITDSVSNAKREAVERKKAVQRAIEAEKAVIDRIWSRTGMRYLDTVNRSGFIANAVTTEPMDREAREFIARNSSRFSHEELMLITDALNKKIRSNYDLWIERRQKMTSDY